MLLLLFWLACLLVGLLCDRPCLQRYHTHGLAERSSTHTAQQSPQFEYVVVDTRPPSRVWYRLIIRTQVRGQTQGLLPPFRVDPRGRSHPRWVFHTTTTQVLNLPVASRAVRSIYIYIYIYIYPFASAGGGAAIEDAGAGQRQTGRNRLSGWLPLSGKGK